MVLFFLHKIKVKLKGDECWGSFSGRKGGAFSPKGCLPALEKEVEWTDRVNSWDPLIREDACYSVQAVRERSGG